MTLYIYETKSKEIKMTMRNILSYTADEVKAEEDALDVQAPKGVITYRSFDDNLEFSSKEDCSETLRADWRAMPTAQELMEQFIYSDQYMMWDGLKWEFDPDNPIPLLRLPFAHGVPNAFYRYVDGKRYVYVKAEAGEITEENWDEVMELWDTDQNK